MIWESSLSWWFSLGLCHDYHLTQCQDQTVSWAREPLTKSPHWCLDQVSSSVQWNRSCLAAPGENMGWLKTANSSVAVSVIQSCPTLCNPMDCSLPGSSVHGVLQARILGWVAISFFRGSFQPWDRTLGLLCFRQILYHLRHQGSPEKGKWVHVNKVPCTE